MGELEKLRHCLALSRNARALVLRDAEAFHEASTALEHIGQVICGKVRSGLGAYEADLIHLGFDQGMVTKNELSRLFEVIRTARNSAVHDGAWARHVSVKLIEFLLILEEGMEARMKSQKSKKEPRQSPNLLVEDIMVRFPVVAETWQMVVHVRREMLTNSFSNLPILWKDCWHVITDKALMHFIRGAAGDNSRRNMLIGDVLAEALQPGKVLVSKATFCSDQDTIDIAVQKMESSSVLLVCHRGDEKRLVGILSAFDLL